MTVDDTLQRDEVARRNANALVRLMHEHNLFIPARHFPNWRPTKREDGDITGIVEGVTIIATDGVLAYFLTIDGETFIGHVQKFTGKIKPLFSVPKEGKGTKEKVKAKKISKRKQVLEDL